MKTKLALLLILLAGSPGHASLTNYWIAASGNYTNPANWSLGAVPGKNDVAAFTNDAAITVSFTADVDPIYYASGPGGLTLDISPVFTASGGDFVALSSGIITATGGGTLNIDAKNGGGGSGSITIVAGANFTVGNSTVAANGVSGTGGSINIGEGGTLNVSGSSGAGGAINLSTGATLTLDGGTVAANHLFATNGGVVTFRNGTITLTDDSLATYTNSSFSIGGTNAGDLVQMTLAGGTHSWLLGGYPFYIGSSTAPLGGRATVLVTGNGTLLTSDSPAAVGSATGGNTLAVSNGANFSGFNLFMGQQATSAGNGVRVEGAGSRLALTSGLEVGRSGSSNRLEILNGGQLFSANGYIGSRFGGSVGTGDVAVVSGAGSLWSNARKLTVGDGQSPGNQLIIADGAQVTTSNALLGASGGNQILVTGSNSVFNIFTELSVTNGGTVIASNGATVRATKVNINLDAVVTISHANLTVANGPSDVDLALLGTLMLDHPPLTPGDSDFDGDSDVDLDDFAGFQVVYTGVIAGEGKINGNVNNGGTISPGESPGVIAVTGNLTLTNTSTLVMEIGGATSNLYDRLLIGGTLTAGGTLTVTLTNAFIPAFGHVFKLFDFAAASNAFAAITLPPLTGGLMWDTSQLYTNGTLRVVHNPADSVGDGIPDWWRAQSFGGSGTATNSVSCATCDPDGEGFSNLAEYLAGTSPTNRASVLRIAGIGIEGADVRIIWQTAGGRTNILQSTPGGAGGSFANSFTDLSPPIILPGTGDTFTNYLHIGGATNALARYYRVRPVP